MNTNTESLGQVARGKRTGERGGAMIAAMFCIALVGFAAMECAQVVSAETQMNKQVVTMAKAKAVATGGTERLLGWCAKWCADNSQSSLTATTIMGSSARYGAVGNGAYSIVVTDKGNHLVELVAYARGEPTGPVTTTRTYITLPVNSLPALQYGLFANGTISSNGNGSYTVGKNNPGKGMYARGGLHVVGKGFYGGEASAPAGKELTVNVMSGTTSVGPDLTMPVLDTNYYYNIANNASPRQVFTDFPAAAKTDAGYTPPGGVLCIDTNTAFSFQGAGGKLVINGILLMKGGASLTFKGNGNLKIGVQPAGGVTTPTPALIMAGGGSVDLGGNSATTAVYGTIYTDSGDVSFSGTAGSFANIISGGNINMNGGGNGDFVSAYGPGDAQHFATDTRPKMVFRER